MQRKFFNPQNYLKRRGVNVPATPEAKPAEKPAEKPKVLTATELHLHGMINGKEFAEKEFKSVAELVNFANANSSGVTYRTIANNQVVISREDLEALRVLNYIPVTALQDDAADEESTATPGMSSP